MPKRKLPKKSPKRANGEAKPRRTSREPVSEIASTPRPGAEPGPNFVVIRSAAGEICRIETGLRMRQLAMEWTYVLRNRRRSGASALTNEAQVNRARKALESLGVADEALTRIAGAGVVEVSTVFAGESSGWEARILPWEHLLASATRYQRSGKAITIARHLRPPVSPPGIRPPQKVLYVESAPCGLRDDFSFDAEERLVRLAFSGDGGGSQIEVVAARDPTRDSLRRAVADVQPDAIHIAGFDAHQAHRVLPELRDDTTARQATSKLSTSTPKVLDGYLLRRDDGRPDTVSADDLAAILNAAPLKPALVSFNIFNSAARLAALTVARGAGAAIGYQDDFSDRLSEVLYERLYWAWCEDKEDLLSAFQYAWSEVRQRSTNLGGTGVVLWGGNSWFDRVRSEEPASRLKEKGSADRKRILSFPGQGQPQELITADVKPHAALNYSILHNSKEQSVFERFVIAKPRGRVHDLGVQVSLHLADHTTAFEITSTPDDPLWSDTPVDLAKMISVPLISPLLRGLRDSTKTLITVRVGWGPHVVYHRTHQVTLLAIDEWRDDDENRRWLPSFVLPGDAAVRRIIDAAQRYLIALADDPAAGFDGYQSGEADDVDAQAQAIWTAIVQDFNLSYINPPPGGADSSQRVRSPSAVVEARHGTCIDLALLYTACLEYVDIYPTMFLLSGHAFPGYWRSEAAHAEFEKVSPADVVSPAPRSDEQIEEPQSGETTTRRWCPWTAEKWIYPWLLQRVRSGALVPLESVFLTSRTGFDEAIEEGAANLSDPAEFDSIQDVRIARANEVTPLPLHGGRS
ncbi:hypothetical protein PHYC_01013 [Phycisphaerales bacterium]|nr:hypothetical protein PHYC_01013 [Phycisphaerales bacterium]